MLRRLNIRDFVLVDRLELDFGPGFGALTGETGAGKSILVDALAFVLGERADAGIVRAGRDRAEVAAEFTLEGAAAVGDWMRDNDFEVGDELLLRRVIDAGGRSRGYINGSPATLQQLREVAESLVDIHGQHAHQSLLRADAQRALVDGHAGLAPLARRVGEAWRAWRQAEEVLAAAAGSGEVLAREREQLEWQLAEVDALAFAADEWESLEAEHRRLAHAASLADGARFALDALAEGEAACEDRLDAAVTRIDGLCGYDARLAEVATLLQSAQAELAEAVSALRRYGDRVELDPGRLAEVERRIEAIHGCARKFRVTPVELPGLAATWRVRLAAIGDAGDLASLTARVETARRDYEALAAELSSGRRQAAAALGEAVGRVMQQLALAGGRLEVALVPVAGGAAYGLEQVEFRVAGLAGSEPKPLAKVASGGELSRISLAIQVVTSQAASVPTMVFDEVDVGIGGGVAEVVGRLLRELGQSRQVLCVTHLPQVAAQADRQWRVAKHAESGAIRSEVVALDTEGRVEEIARMLGGVEITAITRQHAREMLGFG